MEAIFETVTAIPAITSICMLIAQAVKNWLPLDNKHIPALCGVLGAILGAGCFVLMPGYIPVENMLAAILTGAASGWAATGIHQTGKQEAGE